MTTLRSVASALMNKGVLSPGWYAVLTGAVMLYLAYVLTSVANADPAAPAVALVLAVTGVWQLQRGLRSELQRRRDG